MLNDDQFDTLIHDIKTGRPTREAGPRQPYPVLRFAAGTALWLVNAILTWALAWALLHG